MLSRPTLAGQAKTRGTRDHHNHRQWPGRGQRRPVEERELEEVPGRVDLQGPQVRLQRPPAAVLEIGQELAALGVVQSGRGASPPALDNPPVIGVERAKVRDGPAPGLEQSPGGGAAATRKETTASARKEDIGDSFPGAAWPGEFRYVLLVEDGPPPP
jgi:hypothetical protein